MPDALISSVSADNTPVILEARRTPMGSFQGTLSDVTAPLLGAAAIKAVIANVDASLIDEVFMGCVLSAGLGQAPARQAALHGGLGNQVPCTTVNKMCGSGMKAVMLAADAIALGQARLAIGGGLESMSNAPYLLPKARKGMRMGHQDVVDHMFFDGLEDAYEGGLMGVYAQRSADKHGVTRAQMDAFATTSLQRANEAISSGRFRDEIAPVEFDKGHGHHHVSEDEPPRKVNPEKIPQLKPAFDPAGTITAASSSVIADGAAALLLSSVAMAHAHHLPVRAKIVAHATHATVPADYPIAPVEAIRQVLAKAQWHIEDVDLFEINEAFAVVTLLSMQALNLPHEKVNVNGGACALGHPIGASGARILVTLLHAMEQRGVKRGIAAVCIGGGEATAVALERD